MSKYKNQLYILCGVAGSGKSTWIENHKRAFVEPYLIVSRDTIRFNMLQDDEDYFAHETEVYREFVKTIQIGLNNYKTVIADATHLNERSRAKLIRSLGPTLKGTEVIAVAIKTPLGVCLKQNAQRTGRKFVPENQIKNMYSSFVLPTIEEGFDKIYIYENGHYRIEIKEGD